MKCRCRVQDQASYWCLHGLSTIAVRIHQGGKLGKSKEGKSGQSWESFPGEEGLTGGQPADGAQKYDVVKPVHSSSPCLLIRAACWGLQGLTALPPSFDMAGAMSLAASHGDCTLSECNTFAVASIPLLFQ